MILLLQLAVLVTFYFILYQEDINGLIEDIDNLTREIMDSPLGQQDAFSKSMNAHCEGITKFVRGLLSLVAFNTFFFIIPVAISELVKGQYGTTIPMPMPTGFNGNKPFNYEVTLLLQVCAR